MTPNSSDGTPQQSPADDVSARRDMLARAARSHAWSWDHQLASALADILQIPGHGPWRPLAVHPSDRLADVDDGELSELVAAAATADLERVGAAGWAHAEPDIVYYSPEFAVSELVPQYSGGLGVLAGDHLKAAHDAAAPLAAVGLFYRGGFFSQQISDGWQQETYHPVEAERCGIHRTGLTVEVPLGDETVAVDVRRMTVGRVELALLDTDLDDNPPHLRAITDRLYGGNRDHRLRQEMVLGIGGARAVAALGWTPRVHHLNEGHAAFLAFELIDRQVTAGSTLPDAVAEIMPSVVFTTHTPVPAGIDRFDAELIAPFLEPWAARWGVAALDVFALGGSLFNTGTSGAALNTGTKPAGSETGTAEFNMAELALNVARTANGVSRLHGAVSRELFASHPRGGAITSVTNGVHARSWTSPWLTTAFDKLAGPTWESGDVDAWATIAASDDDRLRPARQKGANALVEMVHRSTGVQLDPDALTIGFARRFATYKRAALLLSQPERLAELIGDTARPVQFVFAGKAHPADRDGKSVMAQVIEATTTFQNAIVFVPDYDMAIARALYWGSDVWLNTPVRPREASGTSGEKAALNGALNCSISDGWWDEMRDERNGFTIESSDATDETERDLADAVAAFETLERDVIPGFYEHPDEWFARVRHVWRSLGPQVTAGRMLNDYSTRVYRTTQ